MQFRKHFETLDGLRGIVAIAVLIFHILGPLDFMCLIPHGFLGVDFFFALSGLVIAVAYEQRLLSGTTFLEFVAIRLKRLYPLLLAGSLFGALVTAVRMHLADQIDVLPLAFTTLNAILILPFGQTGDQLAAFPYNLPTWSLFYELLINFAYALLIAQLTTKRLLAVLAVSALALIAIAVQRNTIDAGSDLNAYLPALARVTFSFTAGILIDRSIRSGNFANIPRISPAWLILALAVIFCFPTAGQFEGVLQGACVLFLFPAIVLFGAAREPSPFWSPLARLSGRISYPLYILHYPLQRLFHSVSEKYGLAGYRLGALVIVEIVVALGLSYLALVLYDEPLRRAMDGLRKKRAPSEAPAS